MFYYLQGHNTCRNITVLVHFHRSYGVVFAAAGNEKSLKNYCILLAAQYQTTERHS